MDYGKSKYENAKAEELDRYDPDETIGSVDELGYAALYKDDLAILTETQIGFVWIDEYKTFDEMMEVWMIIESEYEQYDFGILV